MTKLILLLALWPFHYFLRVYYFKAKKHLLEKISQYLIISYNLVSFHNSISVIIIQCPKASPRETEL